MSAKLPRLSQTAPGALHLCHNQSGLRDYWAVAMLHGSPVEAPFGDLEAARAITGTRTLQFTPGAHYSYVNQNFRILSDILQDRTGRSFAELLRRSVFDRAGMESAILAADTRAMPDGTEGYEGNQATGFRAARNRVLWTGDAGLGASLDDMIAWEQHIDATRDEPTSAYRKLSAPVSFADGRLASYGFGLARSTEFGRAVTGHGGALRGWRSNRFHVASERVSVVVMFNHLADAHQAGLDLLAAVLDAPTPHSTAPLPHPDWLGRYAAPATGLAARLDPAGPGRIRLRFGHSPEVLEVQPDGSATAASDTRVQPMGGGRLRMDRPRENLAVDLEPCPDAPRPGGLAGRFRCAELDAELTVADAGGALYGAFSGFLGQGRMELLEQVGADLWTLPCPRALDHTPPGDWTLAFQRDESGRVCRAEIGCWLARRLPYERVA